MKIAICDDTEADAKMISFALMDISDDLEIVYFDTGQKLIESIRNGCFYSLVFQDIYLKNESGMETAQIVRKLSPETQIIFVTTSLDHALDAYRVQASDYIVKPCSETDIVKAFARVNLRIKPHSCEPVALNVGREIHVFHPDNVIKLESDRHYVVIYQQSTKTERIHMNFADAAEKFGNRFIEIRRGLLVNPQFIGKISGSSVILTDGSTYILPRTKKDIVIEEYTKIMTQRENQI